jgi:low temperature requirement protein LtrA
MSMRRLIEPPRLWPAETGSSRRVTWLELFFDLIFVAAVAQVDAPLGVNYSLAGAFRFLAFFVLIWWAWVGHTLYSTRFDTDDLVQRLLTLFQMFAVAAMAANAKDAFDSRYSAGFAAAYAAMRLVLVLQYLRARHVPESRPLTTHYAIGFGTAAFVWIVSALVDPPARYWLWAVALAIDLGTPLLAMHYAEKIPPDSAHLPERFGLFTIILLGESIVAVMHGMESQDSWSLAAALSAFQGMGIAFCFWWWYFDGAGGAAERPIRSRRQATLFQVWNYAHWPLYIGIALAAVGVKHVVALAPGDHLHPMEAWILCGSVTLTMISLTVIGMTSKAAQRCSCLEDRLLPHVCLAGLTLSLGLVGYRVQPALFVTALTALSVLQVAFSLRGRQSHAGAEPDLANNVPALRMQRSAERGTGFNPKMQNPKSIHPFWPAVCEEAQGADSKHASCF